MIAQVTTPVIEPEIGMGLAALDGGANTVVEWVENHDPEEWNIHNDTKSEFDDIVLSDEEDEDRKNDFDVRGWGVEYTPAIQKEFEHVDQTSLKWVSDWRSWRSMIGNEVVVKNEW